MIFIKDIFPSLAVCFLLALISIAGAVGCYWLVLMTIDNIQEVRRSREKKRTWERMALEAKKEREEEKMFIETERRLNKDGQTLQCTLQAYPSDKWLQESNALQEVEELFLHVFGKLAEAEPGRHGLDEFCAEIKQAIWDWEHK